MPNEPEPRPETWYPAVRQLRHDLLLGLSVSFALNLLLLSVPLYGMQVYDRVLGSGHLETLVLLSLMLLIALLALGAFEAVRGSLLARTACRFEQALVGPLAEAAACPGGTGASGLRDLAQLRQVLTGPAMGALFDAPWLPLSLALVWLVHPTLAAFAGASALLLAGLAVLNDLATRRATRTAGRWQQEAQGLTEALARKAEAARAMGMQATLAVRIGALHGAALAGQQRAAERGGLVLGLTRAARLGVQAGVMGLGAWLALRHELSAGVMMAASILVSKALAPVEQMVGTWRAVVSARESWLRLRGLLTAVAGAGEHGVTGLPPARGRLTVERASVRAADGRPLLRDVGLELEPGTCLAVVGASGAGKSTLCRLLVGIVAPERGTVRLDGARLDHHRPEDLGRRLGYLPQDPMLFAGTVAENIARMGLVPDEAAVLGAAELAGAHEMILRLPDGYATRLEDGGGPLSGGQRQRVGLARALYGRPAVVVLDEPNAQLDGQGEAALMGALARLKAAGTTTVLVTHRPQSLRQADLVLALAEGAVHRCGPREAVLPALFRPTGPATTPRERAA